MPASKAESGIIRVELPTRDDGSVAFRMWLPTEWKSIDFVREIDERLKKKFPQATHLDFHPLSVDGDGTYTPAGLTHEDGMGSLRDSLVVIDDQVTKANIVFKHDTDVFRDITLEDVGIPYVSHNKLQYIPTKRDGLLELKFTETMPTSGGKVHFLVDAFAYTEKSGKFISGFLSAINEVIVGNHLTP